VVGGLAVGDEVVDSLLEDGDAVRGAGLDVAAHERFGSGRANE
jgi:hypothetical protein